MLPHFLESVAPQSSAHIDGVLILCWRVQAQQSASGAAQGVTGKVSEVRAMLLVASCWF
jgi:hypothetical protein